jgi:membrane protease YdiL (CAAX protease family)
MNNSAYLFQQKWKIALTLFVVVSLTFLDKIIPPFGIPIAVIIVFILFRWKKIPVIFLGLFKPKSWLKTVLIGVSAGIIIQVFSVFVLEPLTELLGVAKELPSVYEAIEGNNSMLVIYLLVSWTTAGFGEEIIYRAFFLGQMELFFENFKHKWIISLTISSIIFGFLHFSSGIDAIIGTGITGFIIGMVYLKTNRNIWAAYITHAVADTIAFLFIYSGLYRNFL